MFGFIGYILKSPLKFAKRALYSPITNIFYAIVSKWFILVATLMLVIVYWVIIGLSKIGFFTFAYNAFVSSSLQIKAVAQHCTPLLVEPKKFMDCINNTPKYTGNEITNKFEQDSKKQIQEDKESPINHNRMDYLSPYDAIILKKESRNLDKELDDAEK